MKRRMSCEEEARKPSDALSAASRTWTSSISGFPAPSSSSDTSLSGLFLVSWGRSRRRRQGSVDVVQIYAVDSAMEPAGLALLARLRTLNQYHSFFHSCSPGLRWSLIIIITSCLAPSVVVSSGAASCVGSGRPC